MTIKIITCHDVVNYGASLQALALQTYLTQTGNEVKIIDYLPQYSIPYNIWNISPASHLYKLSHYFFIVRLFCAIRNWFHYYPTLNRKKAFKAFNNKYLHLTHHYNSYEELVKDPPQADIYIAGSDQIWRTNLNNGKDPAFYLMFGSENTKRISYAASFGISHITNGMDFLIKTYLSKFNAISIREISGLNILNKLGINGTLVTDPVFLLSKERWFNLLEIKNPIIKTPYILVYDLNHQNLENEKIRFIKSYAKKHKLKIIAINDIRKTSYADHNINDGSPVDFINLITYAKIVVSDSFHATAFSCIMHTPFRVFFNLPQATRISDFLNIIELSHCMNNYDEKDINIDWNKVQKKLNEAIKKSKCYLDNNIINPI